MFLGLVGFFLSQTPLKKKIGYEYKQIGYHNLHLVTA